LPEPAIDVPAEAKESETQGWKLEDEDILKREGGLEKYETKMLKTMKKKMAEAQKKSDAS
jgi:hypothetical protein